MSICMWQKKSLVSLQYIIECGLVSSGNGCCGGICVAAQILPVQSLSNAFYIALHTMQWCVLTEYTIGLTCMWWCVLYYWSAHTMHVLWWCVLMSTISHAHTMHVLWWCVLKEYYWSCVCTISHAHTMYVMVCADRVLQVKLVCWQITIGHAHTMQCSW